MSGMMKVKKCEICLKFYDESKSLNCPFCGNYTTNTLNSNLNYIQNPYEEFNNDTKVYNENLNYNIAQNNLTQSAMFNNTPDNKQKNKPMTFRRFLLILGVCLLVTLIFLVPIITGSNNTRNNKKTTNTNSTSSNTTQVGTIKTGDITYDGEKLGTVTEKQLENNISLYTFDYTNLAGVEVNISFEFESGFVNKMSQYYETDKLVLFDDNKLIGIHSFEFIDTLNLDYIAEYGEDRYFDDYLNMVKDDFIDPKLEKVGDKYVFYYKEKTVSAEDRDNCQSIAIYDMDVGYYYDFFYAEDEVNISYLDLLIETIQVNK